jgi:hypothetical protein
MSTTSTLPQSGTGEDSRGNETLAGERATIAGYGIASHHAPIARESRETDAMGSETGAMDKEE